MRRLLYVTPVMPKPSGGGLAMRAAAVLAALSRLFEVDLFVVPVAGEAEPPSDFVRRHTSRVQSLDLDRWLDPHFALLSRLKDGSQRRQAMRAYSKPFLSRFCTSESARHLYEWSTPQTLAAVHVMRLYLAPFAEPLLRLKGRRPRCVLDLDEDEVLTRKRLAVLHHLTGNPEAAADEESEAAKYAALADRCLPAFDRMAVSSVADAERLARQVPAAQFAVVPNGYELPRPVRSFARTPSETLRLLFVGTLGYFPNEDAVRFLCTDVLPVLRRMAAGTVEVDIVGAGPAITAPAGVRFHGHVEDLAPFYAAADVAIVPIRAGGGTRIKILEAFAHGVPVVSTTIGAEGIDAMDGRHLLIADSADTIAKACLRIKLQSTLAEALAESAASLCAASHGADGIAAAVEALYCARAVR